jgi:hypothetical protein
MMEELWTIDDVAKYLKVTRLTVQRYMQPGEGEEKAKFEEGVHWVRIGARMPRFNVELIKHWAACGETSPELHKEAIAHHIRQLKKAAGKRK